MDVTSPEFVERFAHDLLKFARPIALQDWTPAFAVTIIGQLQLALRHPLNKGYSATLTREFVDSLIDKLSFTEVIRIGLQAGDNPECDVDPPTRPAEMDLQHGNEKENEQASPSSGDGAADDQGN